MSALSLFAGTSGKDVDLSDSLWLGKAVSAKSAVISNPERHGRDPDLRIASEPARTVDVSSTCTVPILETGGILLCISLSHRPYQKIAP